MTKRVLLSWSSGKDSAWALHQLKQDKDVDVIVLLTTCNSEFERVAIHGVRNELLVEQVRVLDLPLIIVPLPWPCSNQVYEQVLINALGQAQIDYGITHVAHGDLFLEDVRQYRENLMKHTELEPLFPLWRMPTDRLAKKMVESGLRAYITCLDPKQLDESFVGRIFDQSFLNDLPDSVDPCGENGEFHTFVFDGSLFKSPLNVKAGEIVSRDGFVFVDLLLV